MPRRLLLADDHPVVRQGLRALLESKGFEIVGEAADGHEALALARQVRFDVAVLDLSMPRMNGIDCAAEILAVMPNTKVVLLTVHAEEHQMAAAFRAGVRGYVCKNQGAPELTQAINEVAAGGTYLSPQVSKLLLGAYLSGSTAAPSALTLREREVLQLVAEGNTTKQVASALGLTTKTAESYRTRLMAKLDIHDTAGLVRYAIRHGVIQLAAAWFCALAPAAPS